MTTVMVPAKANGQTQWVFLDQEDSLRLGDKSLSVGSHGYAQGYFDGRVEVLHRWIMGGRRGDGRIVDHVNRDRLDCCRSNLRFVTPSQNTQNRRTVAEASGAQREHNRWVARCKLEGKEYRLGRYATREEAEAVAAEFRRQHFTHLTL